ncbi:DeoR/GlpR family DNA-binding transcription regulator [Chitinophaga sp. sic0106]|uniref:DeoR/GlpR family DNA-binding transcription regulator n=1 Tax=Chitinophaga sp. sic0106 TaxID=2854785 RepID=UPI001C489B3F|nr:DeoR/GlpR family DNA-binding transcription regulator [Chitinophaga sp. sic0106]MBV7532509.1 DeoR/GlpR family DNA-binding transcription regulator [Chitinophaga sp. sic0106]
MMKEQRFDFILNELKAQEQVTYEMLATSLLVSEDTVRRDIDQLYRNGLLSKIRGGAMLPSKNPLTFRDRSDFLCEQKKMIALKAIPFLKSGMTLFMDGGTTVCTLAKVLPADISLRVITNNQPLVPILEAYRHIEIIVLGGVYDRSTATNTGTITCREAEHYMADMYVMGTCGIDDQFGITCTIEPESHVKRTMLRHARQTISLSNHNILHRNKNFRVAAFDEIDILITDLESDHADLDAFRNQGVQLV